MNSRSAWFQNFQVPPSLRKATILQYNNPINQAGMYNGAGANYYNNPTNQSLMTSGSSGTNYFSGSLGAAAGAVGSATVVGSLGAGSSRRYRLQPRLGQR